MADWSDVRFFLELTRAGTFAAAAERLSVDATTVGRRLSALEAALGAKLHERTPDGLRLTPAGEAMRESALEMEQAALRGEQRALGSDRRLAGVVRVATTDLLAQAAVLPAVRALRALHPDIRVELATGPGRLDLSRREADVALRYVRPESGELHSRRIAQVGFTAYASREYLRGRRAPVRGGGLAGHDVVAYDAAVRAWRSAQLAGEALDGARIALRTNSSLTLVEAVAQGLGIGALPCLLGDARPGLVRVFSDAPVELDDVWLVLHADVQRTSRVRAVIDAIEARIAELGPALRGEREAAPRPPRRRPQAR